MAELYLAQGCPEIALRTLHSAAQFHDENVYAQMRYAQALLGQGKQQTALAPLRVALGLDPQNPTVNRLYVRCFKQLGRDEEMLMHIKTALNHGVVLPGFYLEAARIAKDQGAVDLETRWLTQGIQTLPQNSEILSHLVNLSLKQLDPATLEEVGRQVLEPEQMAFFKVKLICDGLILLEPSKGCVSALLACAMHGGLGRWQSH